MTRDEVPQIPCPTCGAMPTGTFHDGSPLYGCYPGNEAIHTPIFPGDPRANVNPNEKVWFDLPDVDVRQALKCGETRLKEAIALGWADRLRKNSLPSHQLGALGEFGFAFWRGIEIECTHGVDYIDGAPDVDGCQVRSVPKNSYGLKVRGRTADELKADPDDTPCVLAFIESPHVWLKGWLFAREARALLVEHPEFWWDPGDLDVPVIIVPPRYLHPMYTLTRYLEDRDAEPARLGHP